MFQCKDQNMGMLERACLAVEGAAKGGGVAPEVLFHIAKHWLECYERLAPKQPDNATVNHDGTVMEAAGKSLDLDPCRS